MEAGDRQRHADSVAVAFEDGLGQRMSAADPHGGAGHQWLVLRPALSSASSFEFALRERAERLADFEHPQVARVVALERQPGDEPRLRVAFTGAEGARLSDLLRSAQVRQVPVGIGAALFGIGQLASALVALHAAGPGITHGAVGPERILITPDGRMVLADHVLGSALEHLRYSRERYWSELRIALPPGAPTTNLDARTDVLQLGLVAIALVLGRPIRLEEFPSRIADVLAATTAMSAQGGFEPLPAGVRGWLARALQVGPERPFATAAEASDAFAPVLAHAGSIAEPAALAAFVSRLRAVEASGALPAAKAERVATPVVLPTPQLRLPSPATPPLQLVAAQTAQTRPEMPDVLAIAAPVAAKRGGASAAPRQRRTTPSAGQDATGDRRVPDDAWTATIDERPGRRWWWNWRLAGAFALLAVIVGASGTLGAARQLLQFVDTGRGTLELTSMPAGAEVFIDGESRGATPLALSLPIGAHDVELRAGKARKTFGVIIGKGEKVTQLVKLPKSAPPRRVRRATKPAAVSAPVPAAAPALPVTPRPDRDVTSAPPRTASGLEANLLPPAPPLDLPGSTH